MKFLLIYNQGNVPADRADENVEQLWRWIDGLKANGLEITRFIASDTGDGKSVVSEGTDNYTGKVFGVSVIEAASMQEALSATKDWPELEYGGRLDILPDLF